MEQSDWSSLFKSLTPGQILPAFARAQYRLRDRSAAAHGHQGFVAFNNPALALQLYFVLFTVEGMAVSVVACCGVRVLPLLLVLATITVGKSVQP